MKEDSGKNIAVPSEILNPAVAPAIIKTGTTARKTKAAKNLNTIAHIALLAVAYAAFITNSNYSVRCLKSAKRIA